MKSSLPVLIVGVAALLLCAGCAGQHQPQRAGFLHDYSQLAESNDNGLLYSNRRLGSYDRFILEPVELALDTNAAELPFSAAEAQELGRYFSARIARELGADGGYEIATAPGDGVARIRFGLTDIEQTLDMLTVGRFADPGRAGIPAASAEGEVLDSQTGEQVAAIVRWGGSGSLRIGLTRSDDAKLAMNRWARDLRDLIDIAHGR